MTKFLTGKITALVAMLAGTAVLSGCETSAGKPEICNTNEGVVNQRCVEPKQKQPRQKKRHVSTSGEGKSNY